MNGKGSQDDGEKGGCSVAFICLPHFYLSISVVSPSQSSSLCPPALSRFLTQKRVSSARVVQMCLVSVGLI